MSILKKISVLILAVFMFVAVSTTSLAELCKANMGNNVPCDKPLSWYFAYSTVVDQGFHRYFNDTSNKWEYCAFDYVDMYSYYRCNRKPGKYHIKKVSSDRKTMNHKSCGKP